jgi:hypothetical protein
VSCLRFLVLGVCLIDGRQAVIPLVKLGLDVCIVPTGRRGLSVRGSFRTMISYIYVVCSSK